MNLIIIADSHIAHHNITGDDGSVTTFSATAAHYLKQFVKHIPQTNTQLLINLGDVGEGRHRGPTNDRYDILQASPIPQLHVIGNHDQQHIPTPQVFEQTYKQPNNTTYETQNTIYIAINIRKDSSTKEIAISQQTYNRVEQQLQKTVKKAICLCHYPITEQQANLTKGVKFDPQRTFIKQSAQIRKLLKQHKVTARISAHTHEYYHTIIDGTHHITVPSFSENRYNMDPTNPTRPALMYMTLDTDTMQHTIHQLPYNKANH